MSLMDVGTLLGLPDHLRKTARVVMSCGAVTADDVSQQTERARAVESGYLNQLHLMGIINKERKGRIAIFYPNGFNFVQQNLVSQMLNRLGQLPAELRRVFWDDMITAMDSRLQVFEKVGKAGW